MISCTDGGSNIVAAVEATGISRLWCLCHLIDLAVNEALDGSSKMVTDTITKVKEIANLYHRSTVASKNLHNIQRQDNAIQGFINKIYKIKQMVRTRWNSCHDMIMSVLLIYDNINLSLHQLNEHAKQLNDDEVDLLSAISMILRPVSQLTKVLEADKTPTSNLALPYTLETLHLIDSWTAHRDDGFHSYPLSNPVRNAIAAFKKKLHQSLQQRLQTVKTDQFYKVASFLTPKFKRLTFCTDNEFNDVRRAVTSMMRVMVPTNQTTDRTSCTASSSEGRQRMSLTGNFGISDAETGDIRRMELENYLAMRVNIDTTDDPIAFWISHRDLFPNLYEIAFEYLHVPMSSASCERIFSVMERIVSSGRYRLLPETSSMLLFMKEHSERW